MTFWPIAGMKHIKLYHNLTLQPVTKRAKFILCKGRNDLRTDIQETCLGALFLQQPKGIQKQRKFEIQSAKEQVLAGI